MTTIDTTIRPVIGVPGVFTAAFAALRDWNDARITRKSLSRLSARELDDIGLCYGDIDDIVSRTATR